MKKNNGVTFLVIINCILIFLVVALLITNNIKINVNEDHLGIWLTAYGGVVTLFTIIAFANFFLSKNDFENTIDTYKTELKDFKNKYDEMSRELVSLKETTEKNMKDQTSMFDFKILELNALSKYETYILNEIFYNEFLEKRDLLNAFNALYLFKESNDISPSIYKSVSLQNYGFASILVGVLIVRYLEKNPEDYDHFHDDLVYYYNLGIDTLIELFSLDKNLENMGYLGGDFDGFFGHFIYYFQELQDFYTNRKGLDFLLKFKEAADFTYNYLNAIKEPAFDNTNFAFLTHITLLEYILNQIEIFNSTGANIIEKELTELRKLSL